MDIPPTNSGSEQLKLEFRNAPFSWEVPIR